MAKKKIYDMTRKEYEKVKKLDHDGMRQHLERVYQEGYTARAKENQFDTDTAMCKIGQIAGIGQSRKEKIYQILRSCGAPKAEGGQEP